MIRGAGTPRAQALAAVRRVVALALAEARETGNPALVLRVKALAALAVQELKAERGPAALAVVVGAKAAASNSPGTTPASGPTPPCANTW